MVEIKLVLRSSNSTVNELEMLAKKLQDIAQKQLSASFEYSVSIEGEVIK